MLITNKKWDYALHRYILFSPCNNNNKCDNNYNNDNCHNIFSNGCQPYYTTQIIKPESAFSEYNEQSGYVTLPSYTKPPPYNPNS